MEDFELTLYDRLEMIRSVLQYVPDDKVYIAFSGGKDSTVLSHLIDEAIPHNKIERVFTNTGIEFNAIVEFVEREREKDNRIKIIKPSKPIKQMLEEKGYPFKSKLHSEYVERYQRSGLTGIAVRKYLDNDNSGRFSCPKLLRYQFTPEFNIKISQKCCNELKKKPSKQHAKETGKTMVITGVRATEGSVRKWQSRNGCVFRQKDGSIYKFNPLSPVSEEFIDWYIKTRNIEICELYKPPYNFERTGCKGCPYNVHLAKELDTLDELLPNEKKQCEWIWKPVYDEYRRIGYRKMRYEDDKKNV